MKKFSRNNLTLVFHKKEDDKKFSFYIENEEELTKRLLATVKTKRVREDKIKHAVNGIFDLIENDLLTKNVVKKVVTLNMQDNHKKTFDTQKQVNVGIAIGAVNVGIVSILHLTGNYQARRTAFFIGMGVHIVYHIIVTFANHQREYL